MLTGVIMDDMDNMDEMDEMDAGDICPNDGHRRGFFWLYCPYRPYRPFQLWAGDGQEIL